VAAHAVRLAVVGGVVCALLASGCGGSSSGGSDKATHDAFARVGAAREAAVSEAIASGVLPPVARGAVRADGSLDPGFLGGAEDAVVRTRDGGRSGPPLRWDLDGDGKPERRITEEQLYAAITRVTERATQASPAAG
jgi:hypothetical protein